jgi:hypothetical protein
MLLKELNRVFADVFRSYKAVYILGVYPWALHQSCLSQEEQEVSPQNYQRSFGQT